MSKTKSATQDVDMAKLVPTLKKLDAIKDLDEVKQEALSFLDMCRFAEDKVAVHKRKMLEQTSVKKVQFFCWNVLMSGQGMAVIK